MNEIALGKENLKKALLEVSKNYLENLELAPAQEVHYSQKLEQKMAKLLKTQRKPYRKLIDAPYKKAIAACLAVFIFFGASMTCKCVRDPVVEFFTGVYEKFAEFFFDVEDKTTAPQVIEEIHTPTYVPDGYELVESPTLTGKDFELKTVWQKSDGIKLYLYQNILTAKITFDTENAEEFEINDELKASIVNKGNESYIFWNTDEYAYSLIICDISRDEIIKIVKSLK